MKLKMSTLRKTWIFDLDGTLVRHNGYKLGEDEFLPGAKEFLRSIPDGDFILFLTARNESDAKQTESFLAKHKIRYNRIIYDIPMGERILFNDTKPSGLKMSYAVECTRNRGLEFVKICIDPTI